MDFRWKIMFDPRVERDLSRIEKQTTTRILDYLERQISDNQDPKIRAKPLSGKYRGLWRYRVGDYRIICRYEDNTMVILVLEIGHRGKIYK